MKPDDRNPFESVVLSTTVRIKLEYNLYVEFKIKINWTFHRRFV
jgi:hypothetical protein